MKRCHRTLFYPGGKADNYRRPLYGGMHPGKFGRGTGQKKLLTYV